MTQPGDKVAIRIPWARHEFTKGFPVVAHGIKTEDVMIISSAKGTEYQGSDWIVQDIKGDVFGIGNEQIVEKGEANERVTMQVLRQEI